MANRQWGAGKGGKEVVFPIEFSKCRTIVGTHVSATSAYVVCEEEGYQNNLKSTLLDVYSAIDNVKHPWSTNWISIGF